MAISNEDGLERLFFELASGSRLGILKTLQVKDLKMQELAKKLDLTDTETCRQLQRLSEARLIQKKVDATYRITPYAKLVLDNCSSLGFISKFRDYFLNHNAMLLPIEFRARLKELSECTLISVTLDHINKTTEMFLGAKKQIDTVVLGSVALIDILRKRSEEGVKIRWLMQESFIQDASTVLSSWKQFPEIRTTPMAIGYIVVTDRAASLTIRDNNGAMSYSSFYGEDASTLKWMQDLFGYEFERAKPWHLASSIRSVVK